MSGSKQYSQSVTSIPPAEEYTDVLDWRLEMGIERRRGAGSNESFGSPSSGVVLHLRPENGIAVRETEASRAEGRAGLPEECGAWEGMLGMEVMGRCGDSLLLFGRGWELWEEKKGSEERK